MDILGQGPESGGPGGRGQDPLRAFLSEKSVSSDHQLLETGHVLPVRSLSGQAPDVLVALAVGLEGGQAAGWKDSCSGIGGPGFPSVAEGLRANDFSPVSRSLPMKCREQCPPGRGVVRIKLVRLEGPVTGQTPEQTGDEHDGQLSWEVPSGWRRSKKGSSSATAFMSCYLVGCPGLIPPGLLGGQCRAGPQYWAGLCCPHPITVPGTLWSLNGIRHLQVSAVDGRKQKGLGRGSPPNHTCHPLGGAGSFQAGGRISGLRSTEAAQQSSGVSEVVQVNPYFHGEGAEADGRWSPAATVQMHAWLWASNSTSLGLGFLTCKVGGMLVP